MSYQSDLFNSIRQSGRARPYLVIYIEFNKGGLCLRVFLLCFLWAWLTNRSFDSNSGFLSVLLGNNISFKPLKFCWFSITIADNSLAMFQIIQELTLIGCSIFPSINSKTVLSIIFVQAFVFVAVFINVIRNPYSISVTRSFFELAFVLWKIRPCVYT